VGAAGRKRERPAGREAEEPPVGVECVEEGVEVVLVGAAAVQEDEGAGGLAVRGTLENER